MTVALLLMTSHCFLINKIDDSGVYALINHIKSLFPHMGRNGISLYNNPVSSEVKSKLKDDLQKSKEVGCHLQCHAVLLICLVLLPQ